MAVPARQIEFRSLPILHTDNVPRRRKKTRPQEMTWGRAIQMGLFMFALVSLILFI